MRFLRNQLGEVEGDSHPKLTPTEREESSAFKPFPKPYPPDHPLFSRGSDFVCFLFDDTEQLHTALSANINRLHIFALIGIQQAFVCQRFDQLVLFDRKRFALTFTQLINCPVCQIRIQAVEFIIFISDEIGGSIIIENCSVQHHSLLAINQRIELLNEDHSGLVLLDRLALPVRQAVKNLAEFIYDIPFPRVSDKFVTLRLTGALSLMMKTPTPKNASAAVSRRRCYLS